MPKFLTLLLALKLITFKAYSQCTLVSVSTDGYTVTTKVTPVAIIPSTTDCPWGYNYNVRVNYTVTVTGTIPGGALYTMQGYVTCNGQTLFYDLPNGNGTGNVTTGTNPYISNDGGTAYLYTTHPSCTTANPTNMGCNAVQIEINGPGITQQTTNCPNNSTLPVGLAFFTATKKDNEVHLLWQTLTEKDNDFFTVEKSTNGVEWVGIATVKGAGTTSRKQNYSYTDYSTDNGIQYYRLRQTDFDKQSTLSGIVYVVKSTNGLLCSNIWPNPATDTFNFQVNADAEGKGQYAVLDDMGRTISEKNLDFYTGTTEINIPAQDLKAGVYTIEITLNKITKVYRKVVKL